MKFDLDIIFGTIIGMLIILMAIQFQEKQNLQTQIDELRLILNQKFLQEMVTDEPKLRTLEYRPVNKPNLVRISL